MLTLFADGYSRNCERKSRREFLKIGTLGLGGLTLSSLLNLKAQASGGDNPLVKDKAVVMLNLQGGPTQFETFDPKMTAPVEYRAMFGEVKTKLSGVTFGSHFPRMAAMADRLAIVRSYRHGISSHGTAAMHVAAGGNPTGATMGTLFSRVAGMNNRKTGIPNNTIVVPAMIDAKRKFNVVPSRVTSTGSLPASYKTFDPSAGSEVVQNMKLRIDEKRLDDRRGLLGQLDGLKRRVDATDALQGASAFEQQAFDVILGGIADAFDIGKEDPRLVARYDTSMYDVTQASIEKRKPRMTIHGHTPIALGKQMMMARRLVEAGCGFVTVTCAGWDMHGAHEFEIADGMPCLGPAVDKSVSTFLEDLESRGLSDKVLLVITGEFGRTPKINAKLGRDHWGNLCTLAFAGGGLSMGQVIGQSDRTGSAPATEPISSNQLLGTVMHTLLEVGKVRIADGIPDEVRRVIDNSQTIPQLL